MARPRKLNVAKTGNHNKEDLEYQELKENGLSQFNKIDIKSFPTDLTKEGKKWKRIIPLLEQLPIA